MAEYVDDYGEEPEEEDEEEEEGLSDKLLLSQPFYNYDEQTDEQYYIIDNESEQPEPVVDLSSIETSTVEAVKKRLINDPQYRRELLERVLPQFSKLNEQFANSFLYKLKSEGP